MIIIEAVYGFNYLLKQSLAKLIRKAILKERDSRKKGPCRC